MQLSRPGSSSQEINCNIPILTNIFIATAFLRHCPAYNQPFVVFFEWQIYIFRISSTDVTPINAILYQPISIRNLNEYDSIICMEGKHIVI